MEKYHLHLDQLTVGYNRKPLISDIQVGIAAGEIVTMIGPNGAGKSTILKSIIRQLALIGGRVVFDDKDMRAYSFKEMSTKVAVVLTERMKPELMTCHDVVAAGRYPYTGRLGILTVEDEKKVDEALRIVHAAELGERDFNAISDGQRQRILLARAICQEPELILLDEPTSFLDVRHKLDLLSILRDMAKKRKITVLMSLHEIDLAMKVSDKILCVKGAYISHYGTPEEVFNENTIRELYDIDNGYFDPAFGSIELPPPQGEIRTMVISSGGSGIPVYRRLQKEGRPFAAGILYKNDIDYQLARLLAQEIVAEEPFQKIRKSTMEEALRWVARVDQVLCAQVPLGEINQDIRLLIREAEKQEKLQRI